MTEHQILLGLCSVIVLGVGAQWIGRRLNIPSLLLLLPAGLVAGATGIVEPTKMFGDTLFPLVSVLVSLLLFQSGLGLRLRDLPGPSRGPVIRLVTVGLSITFAGATAVVALATGVPIEVAFVVGAVLTVSGPTVVGPLLRTIRPKPRLGAVLEWEGTVLDPLGATLGVIVLNLVLAGSGGAHDNPVIQAVTRLGVGVAIGAVGAAVLVLALSKFLVTDDMEAAVALLVAIACFGVADSIASEAGLFATLTLGFLCANQRLVPTARVAGFGKTLEVLIIGTLFILLGSLVKVSQLVDNVVPIAAIVAVLVLVVRPIAAGVSQLGSELSHRERALVGWMDPRGIVAAATAAQFAPSLHHAGFDSTLVLPIVFGVIIGTGVIYGVTAAPAARRLGVTAPQPRAVALVGDDPWLAELGEALSTLGAEVLVIETKVPIGAAARRSSLPVVSLVDDDQDLYDQATEHPVAQALVAADSATSVTLAISGMVELLGRSNVYVLDRHEEGSTRRVLDDSWTSRPFEPGATLAGIRAQVDAGGSIQTCRSDELPAGATVLAAVATDGTVDLRPGFGRRTPPTVIALVPSQPS